MAQQLINRQIAIEMLAKYRRSFAPIFSLSAGAILNNCNTASASARGSPAGAAKPASASMTYRAPSPFRLARIGLPASM